MAGAERRHGLSGDRGRGTMPGRVQRTAQRPDNHRADKTGIFKTHFRLGRMHIDVEPLRRHVQKQRQCRMPIAGEKILIAPRTAPLSSLSRTGRPLTTKYCFCAVA